MYVVDEVARRTTVWAAHPNAARLLPAQVVDIDPLGGLRVRFVHDGGLTWTKTWMGKNARQHAVRRAMLGLVRERRGFEGTLQALAARLRADLSEVSEAMDALATRGQLIKQRLEWDRGQVRLSLLQF